MFSTCEDFCQAFLTQEMPADDECLFACEECLLPLRGGVCPYDPEHTPIPEDLSNPEIPEWYFTWLHVYQGRDTWPFHVFTPLPIIPDHVDGMTPTIAMGFPLHFVDAVDCGHRHAGASLRWKDFFNDAGICGLGDLYQTKGALLGVKMDTSSVSESSERLLNERAGKNRFDHPLSQECAPLCRGRGRNRGRGVGVGREPTTTSQTQLSVHSWLKDIDITGGLDVYQDAIESNFGSLATVVSRFVKDGAAGKKVIDPDFFQSVGIRKVGHKRLFEKWFAERFIE